MMYYNNQPIRLRNRFLTATVMVFGMVLMCSVYLASRSFASHPIHAVSGAPAAMNHTYGQPLAQDINTAPTFANVAAIPIKQGETKLDMVVGRLHDSEQPTNACLVTIVKMLSGPPGFPVGFIGIPTPRADGTVTANIEALCQASIGTYVFDVDISDSFVTVKSAGKLTIVVNGVIPTAIPPGTSVHLNRVISPQFRSGDFVTGPFGLAGVDSCGNIFFRFERDDSKYLKKLTNRDDYQFFSVDVVSGNYVVKFDPFIPNRITTGPLASDVLPEIIKTKLTLLGQDGLQIPGTSVIPVTAKVTNDIRLFDNATLANFGNSIVISYQVWDSDLNFGDYVLNYTLYDGGGNQIGPVITSQTPVLQTELNRSLTRKSFNRGQSFLVIQTLTSIGLGNVASVVISLSDGKGNPQVRTGPLLGGRPNLDSGINHESLSSGTLPVVELPPVELNLENH